MLLPRLYSYYYSYTVKINLLIADKFWRNNNNNNIIV